MPLHPDDPDAATAEGFADRLLDIIFGPRPDAPGDGASAPRRPGPWSDSAADRGHPGDPIGDDCIDGN